MKALEILNNYKKFDGFIRDIVSDSFLNEAIKELDAYITNYQGIKRRLDNTVAALAVFQNENKSLVKTLEKYNEEMIEKENERYEIEFLEILSNLKIYAMKNDKLELLKDVIKEEFNL